jgi:ubiquinone/menaquinone biosynthesis C-methylase UbiE
MSVDYDDIAHTYDAGRFYSPEKTRFWLDKLVELGDLRPGSRVLDIGCGTGRYALPLAEDLSCRVYGLDISKKMLEEARTKPGAALCEWVLADAERIPFFESSFDFCLLSLVIHHVNDRKRSLGDTLRILVPGGRCIIRTCSHEQLKRLPDYFFFPSALEIDRERIPDVPVLESMLRSAGFDEIAAHEVISPSLGSAEEYLAKIRGKYTSTFRLISDDDYSEGLAKAEEYFLKRSLPEKWKTEPISVIAATKTRRQAKVQECRMP